MLDTILFTIILNNLLLATNASCLAGLLAFVFQVIDFVAE